MTRPLRAVLACLVVWGVSGAAIPQPGPRTLTHATVARELGGGTEARTAARPRHESRPPVQDARDGAHVPDDAERAGDGSATGKPERAHAQGAQRKAAVTRGTRGTRRAQPADNAPIAWVGTTQPPNLLTLQQAMNAAEDGDTVNIVPGSYEFTSVITVPRRVTLAAASESTLTTRFSVTGGGLATNGITLHPYAASTAVVTVPATSANTVLSGIRITNPANLAAITGISFAGAPTTGRTVEDYVFDNGDNAANGTSYGINALNSTSVVVRGTRITGVTRGFSMAAAVTGVGPQFSDTEIGATLQGVITGSTTGARFTNVRVAGTSLAASTGIVLGGSSGVVMTDVTVTGYVNGITTTATTTGAGPQLTRVTVSQVTTTGISIGATTGAVLKDVKVSGAGTGNSVGVQLARSTGVTIENPVLSGLRTGIAQTWVRNSGSPLTGPEVTGGTITDTVTGIAAANSTGFRVVGTSLTLVGTPEGLGGNGISGHEATDVLIRDVTVKGYSNPTTPARGSNAMRFYYSDHITSENVTLTDGATGFYWDMTTDATVTHATVSEMDLWGTYAESVVRLRVQNSTFTDNAGVANLTINGNASADGLDARQTSRDVTFVENVLTDNPSGVLFPFGADTLTFLRNRVSGAPANYVVYAAPAHHVVVADNEISFTPLQDNSAAVRAGTPFENLDPETYPNTPEDQQSRSSSNIQVLGNVFTGPGPMIQLGERDGTWRVMRDSVLVRGNTFPRDSVAIRTFPNAETGRDANQENHMIGGNTAVDARDTPAAEPGPGGSDRRGANDWGSHCGPRVTAGDSYSPSDTLIYDGGGAWIHQTRQPQVLYPTRCSDIGLSVTKTADPSSYTPGRPLTYTIVVSNAGPQNARAVRVVDPLPAQLTAVTWTCRAQGAASACADPSGTGGIDTTVEVAAGGQVTFVITATPADDASGDITNTATVTPAAGTHDPGCSPSCSSTQVVTPQTSAPVLRIEKTVSRESAKPGDKPVHRPMPRPAHPADSMKPGRKLTYTITVTNDGTADYTGASITDDLSDVLDDATYNDDAEASTGTVSYDAPKLTWKGDVPAGERVTITYSVTVRSKGGSGDGQLANAVTGPADSNCAADSTDPACRTNVRVKPGRKPHHRPMTSAARPPHA